jgi:hypothetical protein
MRLQFRDTGVIPGRRFLENFLGTGGAQLLYLRVNALGRPSRPVHSRKSSNDSATEFWNKKALKIQGPNFVS